MLAGQQILFHYAYFYTAQLKILAVCREVKEYSFTECSMMSNQ